MSIFCSLWLGLIFGPALGILVASVTAGFTGGAGCGYKAAAIAGSVTEAYVEGQIFDTSEARIQVGYEENAKTVHVSNADLYPYLGTMVRVHYVSCWLADYRKGESNNYVVAVESMEAPVLPDRETKEL